ncbi:hypothetical protein [Wenyingzhuangia marina]|uniref:Uncharacterized protein n=1 Tax=Wenyingzhuangia marina TaxID=1195760 RepID=A0A1M5TA03_9FLAO|nr:hypothetical protein [Wenyingzhuangia marina]GGF65970.1 hypothetical protein GCM10011397_06260 [Wenyingzhuangia marina]SHH47528.1 hypothetical protein SAMN05444281_0773 [Wenyingzhuangia marina]
MKKLFARILRKEKISFNEKGIFVTLSDDTNLRIKWNRVEKIILLDVFEEYSGYFLTEDYKSKVLYHDISIACNQNVVRIRTGGTPKVRKNTSKLFSRKFGTTSIYFPIFVEYIDESGNKNLYANHYDDKAKLETIEKLSSFIPKDKIHQKNKIEGFTPLSEI